MDGEKLYFDWLKDIACGDRTNKKRSYSKLLDKLHSVRFIYSLPRDYDREADGISMRWTYYVRHGREYYPKSMGDSCSMLEMMVGLAMSMEYIMDDPEYGDRTSQWFFGMVTALGLGSQYNSRYDEDVVDACLYRFFNRDYDPNGSGGLFRVVNSTEDMRELEIWVQANRYVSQFL